MNEQRIEFNPVKREAELRRLEALYEMANRAYMEAHEECERATTETERDRWHQQRLVGERNAMQSALGALRMAIDECKRSAGNDEYTL